MRRFRPPPSPSTRSTLEASTFGCATTCTARSPTFAASGPSPGTSTPIPGTVWSLTRYDDIAAARDWETFSSAFGVQVMTDFQGLSKIRPMITADPPKHTKLKRLPAAFTPVGR